MNATKYGTDNAYYVICTLMSVEILHDRSKRKPYFSFSNDSIYEMIKIQNLLEGLTNGITDMVKEKGG